MFYVQIAILGIVSGCVYALSATGLVLTYTATGVFNIAHFTVALLAAYLGWQLNGVWGVPILVTLPIVLLLCGPVLGLLLERVVFRPLHLRRADSSEKLVAALGVTVALLAVINIIWGPGVQGSVEHPVPRFSQTTFEVGSLIFDYEQVGTLLATVAVAGAVFYLLRGTMLGVRIRAVVDRRELAQLTAIDANRVSQVAWVLGCTIAAVTGLIITQGTLEPTRIIFLGIETFSVAVVARLVSIPVALVFGFLVMGMGRSLLGVFAPFGTDGAWAETYTAMVTNLSSIVLFAALVVFNRLDEVGTADSSRGGLVSGRFGGRGRGRPASQLLSISLGVALVLGAWLFQGADLRQGHRFLALVVIFVSIVAITGFSGHLTLGQASIAGLGAFATARAANTWDLPVLVAMVFGALVAVLAGFVAGYPALRRRGLFLGLTTLALALLIDRFVFNEQLFQGGPGGLTVERPTFFGIDLSGDVAFYLYELVLVGIVLVLARNLRRGRLGRVLGAMRDSDVAAQSVGIELRRAKLFVFGVSAAMAGVGGAMLTQANQAWDTVTFNPVFGLFWFTAVVVCGVSSIRGAILGAFLFTFVPHVANLDVQSAVGLFGIGAVFIGFMPGGAVAQLGRLGPLLRRRLAELYREEMRPPEPIPAPPVPSEFAERVLAERALAEPRG